MTDRQIVVVNGERHSVPNWWRARDISAYRSHQNFLAGVGAATKCAICGQPAEQHCTLPTLQVGIMPDGSRYSRYGGHGCAGFKIAE